jgi:hypothetical protein
MTNNEPTMSLCVRASNVASRSVHAKLQLALFGGILVAAILGISLAALVNSVASRGDRRPAPSLAAEWASVVINGANELGPDGRRHDSWSVTSYRVAVGRPLRLRIDNRDGAPHTMTAPAAGISIIAKPGVHTYTIVVRRAGRFRCSAVSRATTGRWRTPATCPAGSARPDLGLEAKREVAGVGVRLAAQRGEQVGEGGRRSSPGAPVAQPCSRAAARS